MSIDQQLINMANANCIGTGLLGCYPQAQYTPPALNKIEVERVDNGYIIAGSFRIDGIHTRRREVALDASGLAQIMKRWGVGFEKE